MSSTTNLSGWPALLLPALASISLATQMRVGPATRPLPSDVPRSGVSAAGYRFERVPEGFAAANAGRRLRTRWTDDEIVVMGTTFPPTGCTGPTVAVRLLPSGDRDGGGLPRHAPVMDGARLEWRDGGRLTQWCGNDAAGTEIGVRIDARPESATNRLSVDAALTGASVVPFSDGAAAMLVTPAGRRAFRIRDVAARDASGASLPASVLATAGGMRVEVDDATAAYPVDVTWRITGREWTADGSVAGEHFGAAIAVGDVNGDGHADAAAVASGTETSPGRLVVYLGSANGLSTTPSLTIPGSGLAAAMGGDVNHDGYADLAVGRPTGAGRAKGASGRVEVYLGSPTGLVPRPSAILEGDAATLFGASVAFADVNGDAFDDVIVGAPPAAGSGSAGKAYAYLGWASGPATLPAWTMTGNASLGFGRTVASAGDVNGDGFGDVLVAAPAQAGRGVPGSVTLAFGSARGLSVEPAWVARGTTADDGFGRAVGSAGDVDGDGFADVLVGVPGTGDADSSSRVLVFAGSAAGLTATPRWTLSALEPADSFGAAVAPAGDLDGDGFGDVFVGAPGAHDGAGAALLFRGSVRGPSETPDWKRDGAAPGEGYGGALASGADLDGDARPDLLVGASTSGGVVFDGGRIDSVPRPMSICVGIDCSGNETRDCSTDDGEYCDLNDVTVHAYCTDDDTCVVCDVDDPGGTCRTVTLTYTVYDEIGDSASCTRTIKFEDTTPPTITCPDPVTVTCRGQVPDPDATEVGVSDDCAESISREFVGDESDGSSCPETITRTYRATDDCEDSPNSATCTQTITVERDGSVSISCPENATVECRDHMHDPSQYSEYAEWAGSATGTNCAGTSEGVEVTSFGDCDLNFICFIFLLVGKIEACDVDEECFGDEFPCPPFCDGPPPCPPFCGDPCPPFCGVPCPPFCLARDPAGASDGTSRTGEPGDGPTLPSGFLGGGCPGGGCGSLRWFVARDTDCGGCDSCSRTFTIVDTTPPVLVGVPEDATVQCDEDVDDAPPVTATDNCADAPQVYFDEALIPGDCPNRYTITRTWTAYDDCKNSVSATQTITVNDTTPPTIDCPGDVTIGCDDSIDPSDTGTATATDNCAASILRTVVNVDMSALFNADVIVNDGTGDLDPTQDDLDDSGWCLETQSAAEAIGCPTPSGLPDDGSFPATTFHPAVQLGYSNGSDGNNALQLLTNTSTATVPVTPGTYERLHVFATSGDGTFDLQVIATYDDASTEDLGTRTVHDWFHDPDDTFDAYRLVDGMDRARFDLADYGDPPDDCEDRDDPAIFGFRYTPDAAKTLVSVELLRVAGDTSNGKLNIFGITGVTVTETTGTGPEVTYADQPLDIGCGIYRTWTATDACGNTATCVQTIAYSEAEPPTITCPDPIQVPCVYYVPEPDPDSVTASGCGTVRVEHVSDVSDDRSCPEVITRTYRATDSCGHVATCTQAITVTSDGQPIITHCPGDFTYECDAASADDDGEAAIEALLDWVDSFQATSCDGGYATLEVHSLCEEVCEGKCLPPYGFCLGKDSCSFYASLVFVARACGRQTECFGTFTIADTTPPELSGVPDDATIACNDDVPGPPEVTAFDACEGPTRVAFDETSSGTCPRTIARTWTSTDACGNTATATQTITVNDTTAPTLVGVPEDTSVECDAVPPVPDVTATDNCDEAPSVTPRETRQSGRCPDAYVLTRTWTARDACGNTSSDSQTITVNDTTPPTFTSVPENTSAECDAIPPPGTPAATDTCDTSVTIQYLGQTRTNGRCRDEYTLTRSWRATDNCANSTTATQTIDVHDTKAPVLTKGTIASCYTSQAAAEAAAIAATRAVDACGGPVTKTATTQGKGCVALIQVTGTDSCGNAATVDYLTGLDTVPPVLTKGTIGTCYPSAAAAQAAAIAATTAVDNCGGAVTKTAATSGTCTATVTVTGRDACGNAASVQYATRVDGTPPTVTRGTIAACYTTSAAAEAAALAATSATDNCPGVLTKTVSSTGTCTAVVTVVVRDGCGNATNAVYSTRVDTTPPTLTKGSIGTCYKTAAAAESAAVLATRATDNCPGTVTKTASTIGTCTATVTVIGRDTCGNTSAPVTYATRIDGTPPVLTGVPPNQTLPCYSSVPPRPNVTANDNCDGARTVTFTESRVNGNCPGLFTVTRKWTATDTCGNSVTATQTITAVDTVPPVVTGGGTNLYCLWPPNGYYYCFTKSQFSPRITDNCTTSPTWKFVGCASDQPDDGPGLGDGATINDCVVLPGGTGFCVRSERDGMVAGGRHYSVMVSGVDCSGNTSVAVRIGYIYVPRDLAPGCLEPNGSP